MLTRDKMEGVYALIPTPFTGDGKFDEDAFRENVQKLCSAGVHGIATTGTVGEFHTIPWEDHKRLIKALVEEVKEGVVAIAGCSGVNTGESVRKTKFAEDCGADAVMNVVPFYLTLSKAECIEYFKDLSEACPNIGIVVYNIPETTKVLLDATDYRELAALPNLCGSKEMVPDFCHWLNLVRATNLAHMHVDTLFVPTMMWHGRGVFSGVVCLKPELVLGAYEACKAGNWAKAMDLQFQISEIYNIFFRNLFKSYSEVSAYKALVNLFAFIKGGHPRKPFLPVPEDLQAKARQIIVDKFL